MFEPLLLIGLVVFAVWILSSIFRGTEDDRRGQQRPPLTPRDPGASPARQRPPATTVDRFLEEINRRRREAAERQPAPGTARSPVPTPGKPRPESPRRQPRPAPTILSPQPTRPPAPRRVPPAEVVVAEVQYPQVEAIEARRPKSAAKPANRSASSPPPEKIVVAEVIAVTPNPILGVAVRQGRPASARATQLIAMLHNHQMLRNALILHEILGPPLCERGG